MVEGTPLDYQSSLASNTSPQEQTQRKDPLCQEQMRRSWWAQCHASGGQECLTGHTVLIKVVARRRMRRSKTYPAESGLCQW